MATKETSSQIPTPPRASSGSPRPIPDTTQNEDAAIVAHQAQTVIEVEDTQIEDDGYATDAETTESSSLSSSVRDFAFENRRRYHKFREGNYPFPNDDQEQEREDMKHAMVVTLTGGRLHFAPLEKPQNIIDLGTGTGIWAIDMGDEYPSAAVIGIDFSPIQPIWVPPNVKFMVDDAESSWLYPRDHFDFVHARNMVISVKNLPKLIANAYEHLKPGGWIEIQDFEYFPQCDDGSMRDDYALSKWVVLITEALKNLGIDLVKKESVATDIENAGFVNVQQKTFKTPVGLWPKNKTMKTVGLYQRTNLLDGMQGISMGPLTRGLGWSPEQVETFLVDVRKSLFDVSQHTYYAFYSIYGQKPLEKKV